jgi:hypothetical protein
MSHISSALVKVQTWCSSFAICEAIYVNLSDIYVTSISEYNEKSQNTEVENEINSHIKKEVHVTFIWLSPSVASHFRGFSRNSRIVSIISRNTRPFELPNFTALWNNTVVIQSLVF